MEEQRNMLNTHEVQKKRKRYMRNSKEQMAWFLQQINEREKVMKEEPTDLQRLKKLSTYVSVNFNLDPDSDNLHTHTHTQIDGN